MAIGPNFIHELTAAGLAGSPIGWDHENVYNRDSLTAEQQLVLDAVLAAHDPLALPVVPLPPLSPRQLRLGLLSTGTTETDVDALIEAITDPDLRAWSRIEWKHATSFDRDHPLIADLAPTLGYTPEQIDTLWAWALAL